MSESANKYEKRARPELRWTDDIKMITVLNWRKGFRIESDGGCYERSSATNERKIADKRERKYRS